MGRQKVQVGDRGQAAGKDVGPDNPEVTESVASTGGGAGHLSAVCLDAEGQGRIVGAGVLSPGSAGSVGGVHFSSLRECSKEVAGPQLSTESASKTHPQSGQLPLLPVLPL